MQDKWTAVLAFMDKGGIAIWVIAALGALTAGLIVWKALRLSLMGAWGPRRAERAVRLWLNGNRTEARGALGQARRMYPLTIGAAMDNIDHPDRTPETRREDIARVAAGQLARTRSGLRGLELIATIAPLVGLLGTVLGMVAAFQALEAAGNRADPSALAGGIWEALLTTAAGMAVAIPASAALTWFESVSERAQARIEDLVTQLLVAPVAPIPPRDVRFLEAAQ